MQTIIGFLKCLCALMSLIFNLYFYLSHNDLDKEIITPMDLTAQMNQVSVDITANSVQFIPYEYALHAAVTILSLCQGSVVCFLVCLPVCAIHMLKLKNKEHKLHCITREEYCKPMYRDKIF